MKGHLVGVTNFAILLLVLGAIFIAVAYWARRTTFSAQTATHRLLFSIVVLLFAIVFKLVSNGLDALVFLIALVGLGTGWFALSAPQADTSGRRQAEGDVAD